jgi:hypothetical protein
MEPAIGKAICLQSERCLGERRLEYARRAVRGYAWYTHIEERGAGCAGRDAYEIEGDRPCSTTAAGNRRGNTTSKGSHEHTDLSCSNADFSAYIRWFNTFYPNIGSNAAAYPRACVSITPILPFHPPDRPRILHPGRRGTNCAPAGQR